MAQATITGSVTSEDGAALAGANVIVEGTSLGAAADAGGNYSIDGVSAGNVTVTASFVGYESSSSSVSVPASGSVTVNFSLSSGAIELSGLEVLSSRSSASAPVAYTDIKKEEMELRLGSRDIPLVLNTTPSVYATEQGGGAGDARINIRGFDQRNFAVMINGVPVNDMENGWVYWSNWDGVGDATSSIQVQRGMSAVNLAVPSIGGTVNIVTDPSALDFGAKFKQEVGSYGFLKTTASFNSGKMGPLAFSGAVVKKTGEGYRKGTFTDAYAYYLASSFQLNKNNKFEIYAVGAPQRHGHALYKQNIAVYDTDLAKELGYADSVIAYFEDNNSSGNSGRDYNQNYSPIPDSLQSNDSKQYFEMYSINDGVDRYSKEYIMERENFFHKPQVNFNWYSKLNDNIDLSTVFYWSGGKGGGTGTYGSPKWDYSGFSRVLDFGASWEENTRHYESYFEYVIDDITGDTTSIDEIVVYGGTSIDSTYSATLNRSDGILRNSVNQQSTIGLVSKLDFKIDESFRMQIGVDFRKAEVGHWREVRDLIGGDYYVYTGNDYDDVWDYHALEVVIDTSESDTTIIPAYLTFNDSLTNLNHMKTLGDKIAYHNTNTIDWRGFYWQGEYSGDKLDLLGVIGFSTVGYTYVDHFTAQSLDTLGNHGSELFSYNRDIGGSQLKLGASYNLFGNFRIYSNYADVSKVPNFDGAINDEDGSVYTSPKLERFLSREYGIVNQFQSGHLRLNYYNTDWLDRSRSIGVVNADGSDGYVYLSGIDAKHTGIEGELALKVNDLINLRTSLAINDWSYQSNPTGFYNDYGEGGLVDYTYYLEGLKVGNQPQYQHSLSLGLSPMRNLNLDITSHYYGEHYADWDPFSRSDSTDLQQSWRIPDYHLLDLHFSYKIMDNLQLVGHIFNLLDKTYVQEATDNDGYNAYSADGVNHSANDASVFLGLPRRFNISLSYSL
jgi:outer membrane cobalamin receptor